MSSTQRPPSVPPSSSPSYAAAVRPPNTLAVIKTDTVGLAVDEVKITTGTGLLPAYRAAPDRPGPHPVVLVVQEIFGLHEYIRDVARRLAKLGYLAIAPDLYFRQGDATAYTDIDALRAEIVSQVPDEQVMADLDACYAWSRGAGGDPARLGITGFCWGGRITWLYAAHQPRLKAGVAWYGRLLGDKDPLHPQHPLDLVGELKAPVLGLYGGKDAGISQDSIEQMKSALAASQNAVARHCEFHVYPDAGHAFAADYRPSYRKVEAEDGFKRLQAWFKAHGVV